MKASDLIKQLERNSEYNEKQLQNKENMQKKLAEIKLIETPFINDLHAEGFPEIESASDLLKLKKVNVKLAALLLKWIPKIDNTYNSQEMLIRGLAIAEKPFDGALLIHLFDDANSSFSLKWAIGNTIASAQVENITNWLDKKLTSDNLGKECEMLIYAAIKYFSYEKASAFLRKLFKMFPLQVSDAFTYIGRQEDLNFLKNNNKGYQVEIKDKIDSVIKKLSIKI